MRNLSASDLLTLWEYGLRQLSFEWALTTLAAAFPEITEGTLAQLSIGQRDAYLLSLREQIFGSAFSGVVICPACEERLEFTFDGSDIRASSPQESYTVNHDDYRAVFRLPNSYDLAAVAEVRTATLSKARQMLLSRCVLTIERGGEPVDPAQGIADGLADAIAAAMSEADGQADVQIALTCPACSHTWMAVFDIVSYFWTELNAWARRMLREVHILASAYGWREPDILALSANRRQIYLEMVADHA